MGYAQDRLQGQIDDLLNRLKAASDQTCEDAKMKLWKRELTDMKQDTSLGLSEGLRIRDIRHQIKTHTPSCEQKE